MADGVVFAENGGGSLGISASSVPVAEGYDEDEYVGDLEPFFYDEAEAVADHERQMRREQEKARLEELRKRRLQAYDRIQDFDPKQGGHYFTRSKLAPFNEFDIDEECESIHLSTVFFVEIDACILAIVSVSFSAF